MMTDDPTGSTDGFRYAQLDDGELAAIRGLERALGEKVCLLAVRKAPFFALEAKIGPNRWVCIREVYPQTRLAPFYADREAAHLAKSALKTLLAGKWRKRFKKHPNRIRAL